MSVELLSVRATNKFDNVMRITFNINGETKVINEDCSRLSPYEAIEKYLKQSSIREKLDTTSYEIGKKYAYDRDDISMEFSKLTNFSTRTGTDNPLVRDLILKVTE